MRNTRFMAVLLVTIISAVTARGQSSTDNKPEVTEDWVCSDSDTPGGKVELMTNTKHTGDLDLYSGRDDENFEEEAVKLDFSRSDKPGIYYFHDSLGEVSTFYVLTVSWKTGLYRLRYNGPRPHNQPSALPDVHGQCKKVGLVP